MKITSELLFTDPRFFGIATASPAQRGSLRIIDGLPLGDLAAHPDVVSMVGSPEAVAALRTGEPPKEVVMLSAIRYGKTITSLCVALRASQTVDVSGCVAGEIPRYTLMSLRTDNADAAFNMFCGVMQKPALRPLLIGNPLADSLMIRHPSGRPVEIAVVAGSRAGAGLVSRWSAGVAFDEAPRMFGAADGSVVNLDDSRTAVLGRLLPGAQALYIGSPWAPFGPVYEMVQEHWGRA